MRPYQNITKLNIKIYAPNYNTNTYTRKEILESVHEKIEKEDPLVYYIYRFLDLNDYENLIQIVNEKTKIVERIQLNISLSYEIKVYGSLEGACLALIEIINQQSGIYLEKDIDYKVIEEFIQLGKKIWIKGADNSIIYDLINIQKDKKNNYYLGVMFFKNI